MNEVPIHYRGFWQSLDASGHAHDVFLEQAILHVYQSKNIQFVLDLGCGLGMYARRLQAEGFHCDAYDGNPNTATLSGGLANTLDCSQPFRLQRQYDCVMSLEVGEHIPAEFEDTFLENVCVHATRYSLLSWAVEGQPGTGHINCRNNDHVITQMNARHFEINPDVSAYLRARASLWWFRDTLMWFERRI